MIFPLPSTIAAGLLILLAPLSQSEPLSSRPGTDVTIYPADFPLPSKNLLPVTKKIHELITNKGDSPAADKMAPYEVKIDPVPDHGIKMIPLPAGTVTLGSPKDEPGREDNEGPQRSVKLQPFWIANTETTWALYRQFMGAAENVRNKDGTINTDHDVQSCDPPDLSGKLPLVDVVSQPTNPYNDMHFSMHHAGYDPKYPAVSMTQHAASKFCEWLSAHTGQFYRLPTEAEWEYAARAGTTDRYYFGNDASTLSDHAWLEENSDEEYQAAGTKKPNTWGLHDMLGNVAEWVLDGGDDEFRSSLPDGVLNPWRIAEDRYPRVTKGGNWKHGPDQLRCAGRRYSSKQWKFIDPQRPKSLWYLTTDDDYLACQPVGFRIVRPLRVPPVEEMHLYWNTDWWDIVRSAQQDQ